MQPETKGNPMTLSDFRAAKRHVDDLAAESSADFGREHTPGFLFPGDLCIEDNPDKTEGAPPYTMTIERSIYTGELPRLTAVLYGWALTEMPDLFGLNRETSPDSITYAFIVALQESMSPENFAEAIIRNADETDPDVNHVADFCSVEKVIEGILDIVPPYDFAEHDEVEELWKSAAPFICDRKS